MRAWCGSLKQINVRITNMRVSCEFFFYLLNRVWVEYRADIKRERKGGEDMSCMCFVIRIICSVDNLVRRFKMNHLVFESLKRHTWPTTNDIIVSMDQFNLPEMKLYDVLHLLCVLAAFLLQDELSIRGKCKEDGVLKIEVLNAKCNPKAALHTNVILSQIQCSHFARRHFVGTWLKESVFETYFKQWIAP